MRFCCFFFQAEDGIRDYKVTGVQTCALPILELGAKWESADQRMGATAALFDIRKRNVLTADPGNADRKSTRLNSSHLVISYAVFCLKKKKNREQITTIISKSTTSHTQLHAQIATTYI